MGGRGSRGAAHCGRRRSDPGLRRCRRGARRRPVGGKRAHGHLLPAPPGPARGGRVGRTRGHGGERRAPDRCRLRQSAGGARAPGTPGSGGPGGDERRRRRLCRARARRAGDALCRRGHGVRRGRVRNPSPHRGARGGPSGRLGSGGDPPARRGRPHGGGPPGPRGRGGGALHGLRRCRRRRVCRRRSARAPCARGAPAGRADPALPAPGLGAPLPASRAGGRDRAARARVPACHRVAIPADRARRGGRG